MEIKTPKKIVKDNKTELVKKFADDLLADYVENGAHVIAEYRKRYPDKYIDALIGLMPKEKQAEAPTVNILLGSMEREKIISLVSSTSPKLIKSESGEGGEGE